MTRRTPFVALLSSYVISVAGTSMSAIAIPWMVLTTTGSAAKTGLVAFAQMAPYVAAQALAGPLVDRAGLRRSFVWGNVAAAIAVGAIPVMYAVGVLTLPVLVGLVAVAGLVRGAADCANAALVPATAALSGIAMERAAGLNAGANRTALLLGAPLAGLLVGIVGSPAVVAIDAATFLVAAAIVAIWIHVPAQAPEAAQALEAAQAPGAAQAAEAAQAPVAVSAQASPAPVAHSAQPPQPPQPPVADSAAAAQPPVPDPDPADPPLRRYWRDLAAGFHFIRGDRLLLGIITMVGITNLLDQGFSEVMLPVWVRDQIGSAAGLGVVSGVAGLGAVLGNLLGAWLGPRLSRRLMYTVGFLVSGAPRFAAVALASTLPPVLGVFLIAEIFSGSLNPVIGATAYERIPKELLARVLGVVQASAWIGIPFGALFGGYAVEAFGIRPAVLGFGAAYLLTTLAPMVFPAWRQLRRPAPVTIDRSHPVTA